MQKITFIDPSDNEKPIDIAIHNLKTADKYFHLDLVIAATHGLINTDAKLTYQLIETKFREMELNTHLIAVKPDKLEPDVELKSLTDEKSEYECIYSVRPIEHAMKELLTHWNTYEKNYAALQYTGELCVNDKDNVPTDTKIYDDKQMDEMQLIMNNKKKIQVITMSPEETLKDIIDGIKSKFNQDPESKLYALMQDGGPIFCFCIDNKIICPYGYSMTYKDSKVVIDIIDLMRIK
jgi:hypothetical protein